MLLRLTVSLIISLNMTNYLLKFRALKYKRNDYFEYFTPQELEELKKDKIFIKLQQNKEQKYLFKIVQKDEKTGTYGLKQVEI